MIYKNITDAMKAERPADKIIRVLNNKVCLAYSQYTNGTYETVPTVFSLNNGTVYSYGSVKNCKYQYLNYVQSLPNVTVSGIYFTYGYRVKQYKQTAYKKQFRKVYRSIASL